MSSASSTQAADVVFPRPPVWERAALALLLVAFFAQVSYFAYLYYYNVVDDSLISLTYVKNFAAGHGLVFNVGERVEGYTNFLWVFALTPFCWVTQQLGVDFVPVAVHLTMLVATADLLLLYVLSRRVFGHAVPALLVVALCAADNAYAGWAIQALEKHFLALFALLALCLSTTSLRHRGALIGVCLACVQMTRADGALFSLAFGFAQVSAWLFGERTRARPFVLAPRELVRCVLVAVVLYGGYFAWRYGYYGYLLPNTFYLKVGASKLDAWARGVAYVQSYFIERGYLPLVALFAIAFIKQPAVRALYTWAGLHMLYLAYVGGDFYPGHRFFVVIMPALSFLAVQAVWGAAMAIGRFVRKPGASRTLAALATLAILALISKTLVLGLERGPLRSEILRFRDIAEGQFAFMRWVGAYAPKGATLVAGDIGSAGYYAGLHIYDIFGIIDPVIAHKDIPLGGGRVGHEKTGDLAYFLEKRPTYFKVEYLASDFYPHGYVLITDMPKFLGVKGIWERDTLPERAERVRGTLIDFSTHDPAYVTTGDAFEGWPSKRPTKRQQPIVGRQGAFISSFHPERDDAATGTLTTTPFRLQGDLLTLRVAGGYDLERSYVALIVDGQRVHTATGYDSEMFARKTWDIARYRGKDAQLEVVDRSTASWGHIMVDHVEQWSLRR